MPSPLDYRFIDPSIYCSAHRVEREIQLEHVHACAAEEAERRRFGVLADQLADAFDGDAARRGDSLRLELGGGRRDVRIETGAARRHHLRRHLTGARRLPPS